MKTRKRLLIVFTSTGLALLCYVGGYLHFVHPMPIRVGTSDRESVEPVFGTARHSIIRLFRPAVAIDQALFSGRWELERFQLPRTNLAGLRTMSPFRARVESVGRTMPYNTGISTLQLGLRFESGYFLEIDEPGATEQMFALAGSLMDTQLHEFPSSWFNAK
jgi:hypothetical protein